MGSGERLEDGLPVFDAAFIAGAGYREESAADRALRAQRITAAHQRAEPWRAGPVPSVDPTGRRPADCPNARPKGRRSRRSTDPTGGRRSGRGLLTVLVVAGLVVAGWHLGGLSRGAARSIAGDGFLTGISAQAPPDPLLPSTHRSLPAPLVPTRGASYRFLHTASGSTAPVTWNPCVPIHYVTRATGEVPGGRAVLTDAIGQLSAATGLRFVNDGWSSEAPNSKRKAYQPGTYGTRWAPVLIAWSTPAEAPPLAGNVAGFAGPTSYQPPGGRDHYVTGQVVLDGPQLAAVAASPDGAAGVRQVVLHELGHLVGLAHVNDPTQLMNPNTTAASPTGFSDGDRHGLALLGRGSCG